MQDIKDRLLDAALPHVPFDGWTEPAFRAAVSDAGITPAEARAACPRGAVDLALHFHRAGDAEMVRRLNEGDTANLRYRDRVAHAVRTRLEIAEENREAVRRGMTLFALPMHAADGLRAMWGTVDAIWNALGDTSDDVNWYTKRATLSSVYSATVLYWLGDESEDRRETWAFLDRRIDGIMQIEKAKARVRSSPVLSRLMAGPDMLLSRIRAPLRAAPNDLPGRWRNPAEDV
ncbi:COQ9 family protein [Jannaschia sp. LMIT008]|uniref:COQ9 family protein n=1 Tax=Jannaschia maritima TaxID=3032585 RepID=UPI002811CF52|nr:COQ9 family protein [Jannaschia sp. LMIT008]